ncbi:MAG: RnfABCDGE type electron transport complex subunit D [Candidatus Pacebacteria bacterium]|nr:RnfABCDGE type electron transport complex subunit D [Candidatus Paceibacterota bacterium]
MAEETVKLPNPSSLVVSSSPHIHQPQNARRVMLTVVLALLPACVAGVYFFGWPALRVILVTSIACIAFEAFFCKLFKRPNAIGDFSALLTGILLGMNLSAATPWWVCVIGALLAIGLGKQLYGGLGYNIFNPALVGRVGLLIAFPKLMTTWVTPTPGNFLPDAVTTATPLDLASQGTINADYFNYFVGNMGGCIGETSAAALLLGGVVLVYFGYIRWQVPTAYITTLALITWGVHLANPATTPTPLFHILTGGLMIGAIFMATDMVTSPMTKLGAVVFGIGCGVVTCVIRVWGNYPEGVSFAILFMNALVPLINRYTATRPFGLATRNREANA